MITVPLELASKIELNLHNNAKTGDINAWLCKTYGPSGELVNFGTAATPQLAMAEALRPSEYTINLGAPDEDQHTVTIPVYSERWETPAA